MTTLRPDLKFLFAHPAHLIAFGFGTGLAPVPTLLPWPCPAFPPRHWPGGFWPFRLPVCTLFPS